MKFFPTRSCFLCLLLLTLFACKEDPKKQVKEIAPFESPAFSADSAYHFIETQLSFGTRVPGSTGHKDCKDWMVKKLESYTPDVVVQSFPASFLTVNNAEGYNIIASFNKTASRRILLAAHWDSRLIAEKDPDPARRNSPIMGADDGASGTAALIEIARIISLNPLQNIGIDIVMFDAEDQGNSGTGANWCIGSKYWSKNPHIPGYFAEYGVLLDMIGARGAQFGYEGYSEGSAGSVLKKIWRLADFLGYGDLFVTTKTGGIEDDHFHVMNNMGIPMVDIINRPLNTPSGFGFYHHTHEDNIDVIDKSVLSKVGHVITQLIYREQSGFNI